MADIRKIENMEDLQSFIGGSSPCPVLKVSASWCFPCRALGETIKGLTQEEVEGVLLGEVDADEEWFEDKAAELGIRGIPVLIAFDGGTEKERVQGAIQKTDLLDFLRRNK